MSIHPPPYKIKTGNGKYTFGEEICCYVSSGFGKLDALDLYSELWNNFTCGLSCLKIIQTHELKNNQILISHSEEKPVFPSLQEEYVICINEFGIMLEGVDEVSLLRAFSTLLQIIRPIHIEEGKSLFAAEFIEIHDKSFLKFRGIHICVFPQMSLNFIKKVIRLSGLLKYSHIILEFWGTLKLDAMPELAWKNAFTKDEIRPLIKEANALGVEVIPMFNHLGHASSSRAVWGRHVVLNQDPKKSLLFEPDGWSWCISNSDTIALLTKVREELIELCGNGRYFHIGCDEAETYATCYKCSEYDRLQLLTDYINSISRDLNRQGRQGIIWGDMFLDRQAWGNPYEANSFSDNPTHKILSNLDKSLIIADWQYYVRAEKFSTNRKEDANSDTCTPATSKHFIDNGFDVLTCLFQDYENIRALGLGAANIGAYGMLLTTWHTLYENMGAIAYGSVVSWNGNNCLDDQKYILMLTRSCGDLIRKLLPLGGSFDRSGWGNCEI